MQNFSDAIVLTGGAGLVGQNLAPRLIQNGYRSVVVMDKSRDRLETLRSTNPDVICIQADLSKAGEWQDLIAHARCVICLQAQIGGTQKEPFFANNVTSIEEVLKALLRNPNPYLIHVSSSVVASIAQDSYAETKRLQEKMVVESGIPCTIFRPTLMFGPYDTKHLGWLSEFMKRFPIFPIPGSGTFVRQPLYVADFCHILMKCIEMRPLGETFDISGLETVQYIDIIRKIRRVSGSHCLLLKVPYCIFGWLLRAWALISKEPQFTDDQMRALVTNETFTVTDWPGLFGVNPTALDRAIEETFSRDGKYSR